ncbi:MAG TPA: enoyl-CoA hydratase-related protein [Thermoanaerobaculia bacterium]|nr:enoyl-CoA hydratase-related protein [Thermoanaerobaculia bacterium]
MTLDRPPLNVLDLAALAALRDAVGELAGDAELALVFVRGAGGRAFSAGTAVQDHVPERVAAMLAALREAIVGLRALPAITVAAVEGHCLGGGMELAMACDLVIATEDSRFGQPEVDLGCYPPVAAALYPARLGPARTLELLATGHPIGAGRAAELGLVQRLLPAGRLEDGCARLAEELGGKSAPVLRLIKRAVAGGRDLPLPEALAAAERIYLDELTRLEDMREGIDAFLEKRPPRWRHC